MTTNYKFTLMDGRELCGFLKSDQPKEIIPNSLKLDSTGEYLSFGNRLPKSISKDILKRAERQYNHHLFTENARLLLANAEKIFSDSRLFLTPVKVQNGLAYTGTSGFWQPTVGIYLEWWLNYESAAIDKNGNPVWYISGSPLSGGNCCSSVAEDGEPVDIAQRTRFSDIWTSFMEVNNRYNEAKQLCESFSLEEVAVQLRGEDYRLRILELKHEMIEQMMKLHIQSQESSYLKLEQDHKKLILKNKLILLKQNREKIESFYREYAKRESEIKELEKNYAVRRNQLRRKLHDNTLEGKYRLLLANLSREYKKCKRELSELVNQFVRDLFDKNPNNISPSDVIHFATHKPLKSQ